MNVESYAEIYEKLKNKIIANQNQISDFNEGSIVNTMIEGFADIIESLYIDTRDGFISNMKNIVYNLFNFQAIEGKKASGNVIFTRKDGTTNNISIPRGTIVSAGDCTYTTMEEGVIESYRNESNSVSISALENGSKYNVMAGKVNVISSIVDQSVKSVTNPALISGGSDTETETQTFERFKLTINGLQGLNVYSLKSDILNNVNNVTKVSIKEHFPPINNYNFSIYIDYTNPNSLPQIKESIDRIMKGDGTINNPGRKAIGINYRILQITKKVVDVKYSVKIHTTDRDVNNEIQTVIASEFNKLDIGQTLYISNLISAIKSLDFVDDVSIITPSKNVDVLDNDLITLGSILED